ncbi:MAG: purine-binding chemotaxis protein CheW [Candidatus Omnitrophota bacterium]|jgi:purine-binding chemotaxis protein CheW|nr:MAG: purine-binding chemotaxis protein CheW [Candidatus Omnitrophota bacterium]
MNSETISSHRNADLGLEDKAGKYLTFKMGKEEYGIEIMKVFEIIGLMEITPVPRTPKFIRGVINLRGKIIPVVDLRLKFELPRREDSERTCIIVVQIARAANYMTMGIIVDDVCEVIYISANQIEPTPSFGENVNTEFIKGVGQINQNVIMLLDIDKILTGGEVDLIEKTVN